MNEELRTLNRLCEEGRLRDAAATPRQCAERLYGEEV